MAKIFAVFNQKGGVGKTTTTINLCAGVARFSKRVLLLDMDPQGNATSGLGLEREEHKTFYDVVAENVPLEETLVNLDKGFDILPANANLVGLEVLLAQQDLWETKLKDSLSDVAESYDYAIIDCPPSLGFLSLMALVAAEGVIIPIQCEYYALEGVSQLFKTVELVRESYNPELRIEGVVMTMFDSRNNLANQVVEEVAGFFEDKLYKTLIPRNVRLAEAPSFGKSIFHYDKQSKGAKAYQNLAQEFLRRQGETVSKRRFFGLFNV